MVAGREGYFGRIGAMRPLADALVQAAEEQGALQAPDWRALRRRSTGAVPIGALPFGFAGYSGNETITGARMAAPVAANRGDLYRPPLQDPVTALLGDDFRVPDDLRRRGRGGR